MKKFISIVMLLLSLVVALWGGATYWFGVKTQERYRALLEQASSWPVVKIIERKLQSRISRIESANHR